MNDTITPEQEKLASEVANARFISNLDSEEGRTKIANEATPYIKQRLREESFARKILRPVGVTKSEVQRAVDHDTVEKICDIEFDITPTSGAMSLNFTGEPTAVYIQARRFAVRFHTISTPWYEKLEQELYAYEMPVVKQIEENAVKDIQWAEDSVFISHVDSIFDNFATSGLVALDATAGATDPFSPGSGTFSGDFDRKAVAAAIASLVDKVGSETPRKLRCELLLVNEAKFTNFLNQPATSIGNDQASKILVDGYQYDQIMQRKLVTTTKVDLVGGDRFYAFAAQRYFGHFFVLASTKFFVQKIAELIRFKTWEIVGMGFGNIRACMRITIGA